MEIDGIKCAGGTGEYDLDCENPFGSAQPNPKPRPKPIPKKKTPKKETTPKKRKQPIASKEMDDVKSFDPIDFDQIPVGKNKNQTIPEFGDEIPQGEYNLDDLPDDAFAAPQFSKQEPNAFDEIAIGKKPNQTEQDKQMTEQIDESDEAPVAPIILSLPLGKRSFANDNEPDVGAEPSISKESSCKQFQSFFSDYQRLESKAWKVQVNALNKLQALLQEQTNLDEHAECIFRGLEKAPGWKIKISYVASSVIDIIRHVLVKSKNIRKATLSIAMPFLLSNLGDKKFGTQIPELLIMMAQAICPSYMLIQILNVIADNKNKSIVLAGIDICVQIVQKFGYGNLSLELFIAKLKMLLTNTNQAVKKPAILIASYLYKDFKDAFMNHLASLPQPVIDQLTSEFEKADTLPPPTDKYYRKSGVTIEMLNEQLNKEKELQPKVRTKITDFIDQQMISDAEAAQKWKEQGQFVQNIDSALAGVAEIVSSDLDSIMSVLKLYLSKGNDTIYISTIALIIKMTSLADPGFVKYTRPIAPLIINKWTTTNQKARDIITACITLFSTKFGPSPFIDSFLRLNSSTKLQSVTRISALQWISNISELLSQSDKEKLQPFFGECEQFRGIEVRNMVKDVVDKIGIKVSEPDTKHKQHQEQTQSPIPTQKQKKASKNLDRSQIEQPKEEKIIECPRFSSATMAKKTKRLQQISKMGIQLIGNKQALPTYADKCKTDATTHLPSTFVQKLFSNQLTDQTKALEEMTQFFEGNETSFYMCSDIFVRWLTLKIFEKNVKVVIDGISFLSLLFNEQNTISLNEMECIVPVLFWCVDNKTQQVYDSAFDLVFLIRLYSDPTEYSFVLRSCLSLFSTQCTIYILSEMQFCIVEGQNNKELFLDLIGLVCSKDLGVAAACGGVLSLIAQMMDSETKSSLFKSLPDEQIDCLSPYIPINTSDEISFDNFNSLQPSEKTRVLRVLIEQFSHNCDSVQMHSQSIAEALSNELIMRDINLITIKPILFSLHEIVARCILPVETQQKVVISICFISNRFQAKLSVIEGIPMIINSILFKLFEKMPAVAAYSALLTGMESQKTEITGESFFAKAWIVLTTRVVDTTDLNEFNEISSLMSTELSQHNYSERDIRGKLISSAQAVVAQKKAPEITIISKKKFNEYSEPAKQQIQSIFQKESIHLPLQPEPTRNVIQKEASRPPPVSVDSKQKEMSSIISTPKLLGKRDATTNKTSAQPQEANTNSSSPLKLVISPSPKKEQTPIQVYKSPHVLSSPFLDAEQLKTPTRQPNNESDLSFDIHQESFLASPSPIKQFEEPTHSPPKHLSAPIVSSPPKIQKEQHQQQQSEKLFISPMKKSSKEETINYASRTSTSPTATQSHVANKRSSSGSTTSGKQPSTQKSTTSTHHSTHAQGSTTARTSRISSTTETKGADPKKIELKARIANLRKRWG